MYAIIFHRRQAVRAGDHVGHDVGIRRIGHTGFKDADHGGGAVANTAQANCFANRVGILFEDGRPEAVREAAITPAALGHIVLGAGEVAENGMEAHLRRSAFRLPRRPEFRAARRARSW